MNSINAFPFFLSLFLFFFNSNFSGDSLFFWGGTQTQGALYLGLLFLTLAPFNILVGAYSSRFEGRVGLITFFSIAAVSLGCLVILSLCLDIDILRTRAAAAAATPATSAQQSHDSLVSLPLLQRALPYLILCRMVFSPSPQMKKFGSQK